MAIGLLVDFLLHLILRYYESTETTREGKVKDTLKTMGSSIFVGGFSTLLGVVPLAFSSSGIIKTVFIMFFAMVSLGLANGLILLPVLLSYVGPTVCVRMGHQHQGKSSEEVGIEVEADDDNLEVGSTAGSDYSSGEDSSLAHHEPEPMPTETVAASYSSGADSGLVHHEPEPMPVETSESTSSSGEDSSLAHHEPEPTTEPMPTVTSRSSSSSGEDNSLAHHEPEPMPAPTSDLENVTSPATQIPSIVAQCHDRSESHDDSIVDEVLV